MDQVNTKTGFIDPGAVPLQAADLLAYELFNPIREMEKKNMRPGTLGRDNLSSVWSILDKIPGEPRVTEEDSIDRFEERVKSFYEKPSGFIKLATWAPK